jgi:hypothetical protein
MKGAAMTFSRSLCVPLILLVALAPAPAATAKPASALRPDGTCRLHGVALHRKEVRIAYGIAHPVPEGFPRARAERFPNGVGPSVPGGCVRGEPTTRVDSCPACDRALAAWCARLRAPIPATFPLVALERMTEESR